MSVSRRYGYGLMIAALLAAAGCTTTEVPVETLIANALPAKTVTARGETTPVGTSNQDAADDPAIWRNAADPAQSLIVGTDKKAGLYVYGLDGKVRDFNAAGAVNNVALVQGRDGRVIVAASDRNDPRRAQIALFALDTATVKLTPLGKVDAGAGEAYGICAYTPPVADDSTLIELMSVLKGGEIAHLVIDKDLGVRTAGRWRVPTQAEGCVVDPTTASLYVGEEDAGIWRFSLAPGKTEGTLIARADGRELVADVEGLAIAWGPQRYLIASSQGDYAYSVYSLPDHRFIGRFRIAAGQFGSADETDGIEVVVGDFGPGYPGGLFVAQDGMNEPAAQNFKLVAWDDVKAALGL